MAGAFAELLQDLYAALLIIAIYNHRIELLGKYISVPGLAALHTSKGESKAMAIQW